jgi:hypothetical protein
MESLCISFNKMMFTSQGSGILSLELPLTATPTEDCSNCPTNLTSFKTFEVSYGDGDCTVNKKPINDKIHVTHDAGETVITLTRGNNDIPVCRIQPTLLIMERPDGFKQYACEVYSAEKSEPNVALAAPGM